MVCSLYYSFSLSGPDKLFINSDRGSLKSFQRTVELVGNGGVGPEVFLMSFPPAVLSQNSEITIFPPDTFFQIHYSLSIVSKVSFTFISLCTVYLKVQSFIPVNLISTSKLFRTSLTCKISQKFLLLLDIF
jgi:hypothetical protein